MTTLAVTDPPLRRLFSRLDFAPRPLQQNLVDLLASWENLRAAAVAPKLAELEKSVPVHAFLLEHDEVDRDYILRSPSLTLEHLTGLVRAGERLSEASKARQAARLRRLFDAVIRAGEPVLAEFSVEADDEGVLLADLLAAPFADAQGRIAGIFGGCELRPSFGGERPPAHAPVAPDGPVIFSLSRSDALGQQIARRLGTNVAAHEERHFEDGEMKIRPLVGVRQRDVYVLADLASSGGESVNDKLCKLLFFVGALKQSAARRVTVVAPYLCYARKERQTKPRDPVVTRYIAQMFEAVGCDRVATVAAHDLAAFQNAFRIQTEHLDLHALFAYALAPRLAGEEVIVVSPDPGGEKRAELFRETLERALKRPVAKGLVDKKRSMGKVSGDLFVGDAAGRVAVVVDDMVSTGGTMIRAAKACRRHGATAVMALAAHGLFSGGAEEFLRDPSIDEIWITDSLPTAIAARENLAPGRLHIVALAPLLADVIRTCHSGGSINELLKHDVAPFAGTGR